MRGPGHNVSCGAPALVLHENMRNTCLNYIYKLDQGERKALLGSYYVPDIEGKNYFSFLYTCLNKFGAVFFVFLFFCFSSGVKEGWDVL